MKKMLFVMNPYAGTRKAPKFLAEIITVFNRAGYLVSAHMTAGPGDAAQVVEALAGEMDLIVCCGGDGTFNETVGRFGGRFFTYVASFGAFTRVSYATPQNVKNMLGHTAYLLEGISELSQIRDVHVRMEMDDGVVEDDFLFGAISNSTSVGGILTLDPDQVDMRDGKFELLLVRAPRSLGELTECIQALQSQHYDDCAMLTFRSTHAVKVQADPEMIWTLDGERADGAEEIDVRNLHLAVRLIRKAEEA